MSVTNSDLRCRGKTNLKGQRENICLRLFLVMRGRNILGGTCI